MLRSRCGIRGVITATWVNRWIMAGGLKRIENILESGRVYNVRSCGIRDVPRNLGNVALWPIIPVASPTNYHVS